MVETSSCPVQPPILTSGCAFQLPSAPLIAPLSGFAATAWRMMSAIAASSAPPRKAHLTSMVASESRQGLNIPSAVRRILLHRTQNSSPSREMKPTRPFAPRSRTYAAGPASIAGPAPAFTGSGVAPG